MAEMIANTWETRSYCKIRSAMSKKMLSIAIVVMLKKRGKY
jgi:hypothetical protein